MNWIQFLSKHEGFVFNKCESVESVMCGLCRLELHHIYHVLCSKFIEDVLSSKYERLSNMFWMHISVNYSENTLCWLSNIYAHFNSIRKKILYLVNSYNFSYILLFAFVLPVFNPINIMITHNDFL